jgi:hypothetical protein
MRGIVVVISLIFALSVQGQNINFIRSYGNTGYDYGKDIKQDLDTGYIVTGSSSSFTSGDADAFLLKVDSIGDFEWSYNYGGPGSDWGESLVLTKDSAYAIGGYTNSFGSGGFDFYLIKTDSVGNPEWQHTYGGSDWDQAYGLVQLEDSGFVLVGETFSYGAGLQDVYIIRTDKNGDTLWTRTYGGPEKDFAKDVILDGDSLVVVGGTESFGNGMSDGIILKYHIDGTLGWVQYIGKERDDYFTSIVKNSTNEYFIGGSRNYYFSQTGWLGDFWIYNITDDGNALLADTCMACASHEVEIIHDLVVDPADNCFWGGQTKSFGYSVIDLETDAFIGKTLNNYFNQGFINNFGEAGEDVIYGMDYCYDDGIVATGISKSLNTGGMNLIIVRVDKDNTGGSIDILAEMDTDSITLSFESLNSTEILLYPNPVQDMLTIDGADQIQELTITDLSGKLIYRESQLGNSIPLEFLASGMYVVMIKVDERYYSSLLTKE